MGALIRARSFALAFAAFAALAANAAGDLGGDGYQVEQPTDAQLAETRAVSEASTAGLTLPGGGRVWVTEDPAVIDPRLAVSATSQAVIENGKLREAVRFSAYTNYEVFQESFELLFFEASDPELLHPIARVSGEASALAKPLEWDGALEHGALSANESVLYVLRVRGAEGHTDETAPKALLLLDPVQAAREELGESFSLVGAAERDLETATYGANELARQTIPLQGSRVRVHGAQLGDLASLVVAGRPVPIDDEGKAVRELVLPLGKHELPLVATLADKSKREAKLHVNVTGKYLFAVAIADVTLGEGGIGANVEPIAGDDHYDESIFVDGRLAFYLKGKVRGKYLITAHADTSEREVDDLFDGLRRRDPRALFRRLDPDRFYPVYGDDSTTISDVDTQGALYLRVDWDKSEALWGSYDTGLTGNEFTQYNRSLYGAKLRYVSPGVTEHGEPQRELSVFGAEPESQLAHNEFLGTGGSLYFLRHTDIVEGSEKLAVEVRDRDTNRVLENITLERGRDYEIDEIQGRILLTRPLLQIADRAAPAVIRDQPLLGNDVYLVADYEFVPDNFDPEELTAGVRGSSWLGDHFQLGGTYVRENRSGNEDYQLGGADLTLRAGRGTFLHVEAAHSQAVQTDTNLLSQDGGLTFTPRQTLNPLLDPRREGEAYALEGRVDFAELSEGRARGAFAAWFKDRDAAFSSARADVETATRDYGGELLWNASEALTLSARAGILERANAGDETRAALQADWRVNPQWQLSSELRHVETDLSALLQPSQRETAGGVRVGYSLSERTELYGIGQLTLDKSAATPDNDSFTLGGRSRVSDRVYLGAEGTVGDRGEGARLGADFTTWPGHQVYTSYAWTSADTATNPGGGVLSVGQRASLSSHVQVFSEEQFHHGEQQSGLGHSFGLDFRPAPGWSMGFTYQVAQLEDATFGAVDRHAATALVARREDESEWSSRLEYRKDGGAVDIEQWLTANRAMWKLSEEMRLLAKADFSWTRDHAAAIRHVGHYAEAGFGLAYRPAWDDRYDLLAKYTYLYDQPTPSQLEAGPDERAHVVSVESLFAVTKRWQIGSKVAHKRGETRTLLGSGPWFETETSLAVANVRYHFIEKWEALAEYRHLYVHEARDERGGVLVGVYRQLHDHLRLGAGYNFTSFNDDLVQFDDDAHGWFVNLIGSY